MKRHLNAATFTTISSVDYLARAYVVPHLGACVNFFFKQKLFILQVGANFARHSLHKVSNYIE